jgi:hypothetical protein
LIIDNLGWRIACSRLTALILNHGKPIVEARIIVVFLSSFTLYSGRVENPYLLY